MTQTPIADVALNTQIVELVKQHHPDISPATVEQLTAAVAKALASPTEPEGEDDLDVYEAIVHRCVLKQVPDAVAWKLRTDEWDNGWFLTGEGVEVTRPDGKTVRIDLDGGSGVGMDDDLADLTHLIGGAGRWTTHSATITASAREWAIR